MRNLLKPQRGIAIGPILMAIALLAVIVAAFTRGADTLGGAAMNSDRIVYELRGQIDMIRSKVEECVMLTRRQDIITRDPLTGAVLDYRPDVEYPVASSLTAVSALECPRDPTGQRSLWQGARPTNLPPQPRGFEEWEYINHGDPAAVKPAAGGICISIRPIAASASQQGVRDAIKKALKQLSAEEYTYDASDPDQRIIIWLKRPNSGTVC